MNNSELREKVRVTAGTLLYEKGYISPVDLLMELEYLTQKSCSLEEAEQESSCRKLNSKLRGYYNYYGLKNNYDSLNEFFNISMKILYKWLNRRSQRRSMNWDKFKEIQGWYGICRPRITEKTEAQLQFDFA